MPAPTRYSVGDLEIDTACYAVFRAGRPVPLEPKAVTLLIFLVEHRARVVSKDELTELLWKDTFVTPNALTRLVAQLRRELGDAPQEPRLIQTVHRRGYRFIAAIEDAAATAPATMALPPARSQSRPASGFLAAAAALLMMAAFGAAAIGKRVHAPSGAINAALTGSPMQVTASLGLDADPALSPDGRQLAWSSDVSGRSEIYAKPIDGGPERQVTRDGMQNVEPAWSPDGRSIAYRSRLRRGVWLIAAAGGTPRRVADFGARPAWSPDGLHLAFGADATVMAARSQIWRARADGSDLAPLTTAGRPEGAHQLPQWSPDGRLLAFVAGGPGSNTLWIQNLASGRLGRVRDEHGFSGLAFAPAGDALLWGEISRLSPGKLWRRAIDVATGRLVGPASPLAAADIGIASGLAIGGGRLAWVSPRNGTNLWSLALEDGRPAGPPRPLTRTTYRNTFPMFSPDGARIAFQVKRPGSEAEVWTMEARGGEAAPLVPANPRGFFPHWTPAGDRVFAVERTSHGQQFAYLDVRSGRRDAVRAVNKERHPRLSPDGTLVAYHQPVSGTLQVFVAPLGTGTPRQISHGDSDVAYPVWSRDGRQLAVEVRNGEDIHVAVMPATGGRMRVVTSGRGLHWPHSWSPDDRHIAYAGEHDGQWNLYSVAADTGHVLQLTDLGASSGYVRYPAWAPDGRSIVFERAESCGNIWTTRLR